MERTRRMDETEDPEDGEDQEDGRGRSGGWMEEHVPKGMILSSELGIPHLILQKCKIHLCFIPSPRIPKIL